MKDLSATSALVLLWAKDDCYNSEPALEYLKSLDLTPGLELYYKCDAVCPFYSEVIKNRKYGVIKFIESSLKENSDLGQIIIAGAGLDALGVELACKHTSIRIFELDNSVMEIKAELVSKLVNNHGKDISFIHTDLNYAPQVYEKLCNSGWDPAKPSLLILEGISYYLAEEKLEALYNVLNPYAAILEYLKPTDEIETERAEIADSVFGIIADTCECRKITRYNRYKIKKLFETGDVMKYTMKELELMRTGTNKYFSSDVSGWIEVCLIR